MDNSFLSRLEEVSGERKLHSFIGELGFKSSIVTRLKGGQSPSEELLRALQRYENASLRWLTEGKGPRHYVDIQINDEDAAALLEELLVERWYVTVVRREVDDAYLLVLSQPGTYTIKDREIEYTIVEILAGNLGQQSMDLVQWALNAGYLVNELLVSSVQFQSITKGELSTSDLVGWKDRPGLLDQSKPVTAELLKVAEPRASYGNDFTVNHELGHAMLNLSDKQQQLVLQLIRELAGTDQLEKKVPKPKPPHPRKKKGKEAQSTTEPKRDAG